MSENNQEFNTKSPLEMTAFEAAAQRDSLTDTGKILPRKYTGYTAKEQRCFSRLIKQARSMNVAK